MTHLHWLILLHYILARQTRLMPIWGVKGQSAIKPNTPQIRRERIAIKTSTSSAQTATVQSQNKQRQTSSNVTTRPHISSVRSGSSTSARLQPQKQRVTKRRSPIHQRLVSDSDDDEEIGSSSSFDNIAPKRRKLRQTDLGRNIRSSEPFSESDSKALIHAADTASLKNKFKPVLGADDDVSIDLHYPGTSQKER